jgi:predicted GTPase
MGYSEIQVKELEKTINTANCDVVVVGTPIDLGRLLKLNKPVVRVRYRIEVVDEKLEDVIGEWLESESYKSKFKTGISIE